MQSLVNAPSQQSALPCKVDYFNDKLMTGGAQYASSPADRKDARALPFCLGRCCMPATAKDQYAGIRSRVEG